MFCYRSNTPFLSYFGINLDTSLLLILALTGLISGFYSGMVGSGGNVILIPILDYVLYQYGLRDDLLVKSIIAHSLVVTFFLGIIVSYRQYLERNFHLKEVVATAILGMISATIMTWLINNGTWYQKSDFDIVFAIMLFLLILKLVLDKKSGLTDENKKESKGWLLGIGGITGVVTSLSGLGGGIILIPGFTDIMKMSLKQASSISISVICLLSLPIGISYMIATPDQAIDLPLQVGYISFSVVLATLMGVLVSAPFGVRASHRVNPRVIKMIFAAVVTTLLVKMIYAISVF